MRDNVFQQRVDTVAAGGTVTWRNDGNNPHTSTSGTGAWDSGRVGPGGTFARPFTQAGSFPYFCTFHGQAGGVGMAGTIVVRWRPPAPSRRVGGSAVQAATGWSSVPTSALRPRASRDGSSRAVVRPLDLRTRPESGRPGARPGSPPAQAAPQLLPQAAPQVAPFSKHSRGKTIHGFYLRHEPGKRGEVSATRASSRHRGEVALAHRA
jgi:hypothetical protein